MKLEVAQSTHHMLLITVSVDMKVQMSQTICDSPVDVVALSNTPPYSFF